MFRFFGLRKRGRKAVAAPRAHESETYSDALLAGWVTPPQGAAPAASADPAPREQPDEAVLERFYRNQR
jgi:hypothetical protein